MHKLGIPDIKHKYRYTVYGVVGGYNPKKDIAVTGATRFQILKSIHGVAMIESLKTACVPGVNFITI